MIDQRTAFVVKQASAHQLSEQEADNRMTAREWGFMTALHNLAGVPKEHLPHYKQAYCQQLERQAERVQQIAYVAHDTIAARG